MSNVFYNTRERLQHEMTTRKMQNCKSSCTLSPLLSVVEEDYVLNYNAL
jgi:hypothetical protein